MKTVGVNGFGRIGRCFTRIALQDPGVNVALVNDLADVATLAHLLKYDSIHGPFGLSFEIQGNTLQFENGKQIVFISERNPELINWAAYGVEVVVDRDAAEADIVGEGIEEAAAGGDDPGAFFLLDGAFEDGAGAGETEGCPPRLAGKVTMSKSPPPISAVAPRLAGKVR